MKLQQIQPYYLVQKHTTSVNSVKPPVYFVAKNDSVSFGQNESVDKSFLGKVATGVENGYAKVIRTGRFKIPVDATYEEICSIIIKKK